MSTKTKTPAKKILLYTDSEALRLATKAAETGAQKLNEFTRKAQSFMQINFTDDQKEEIKTKGQDFIRDFYRAKFPFPDATDEFNYTATGIDPRPLIQDWLASHIHWIGHARNIHPVSDGFKAEVNEAEFEYYVETENQLEAWETAISICDTINAAIKSGFIQDIAAARIADHSQFLTTEQPGATLLLTPYGRYIAKFIK